MWNKQQSCLHLLNQFLTGGSLGVKSVNPSGAVEALTSDAGTLLVDIRSREEIKEQGSPNLSATKKKAILLPFTRVRFDPSHCSFMRFCSTSKDSRKALLMHSGVCGGQVHQVCLMQQAAAIHSLHQNSKPVSPPCRRVDGPPLNSPYQ